MKCIKLKNPKGDQTAAAIRVSNEEAERLVATGKWNYTSKSEWKEEQFRLKNSEFIKGASA